PAAGIYLLEASGHAMVYVDGEPRAGDPYDTGYVRLPVALRAGRNDLLFACGRGHVRARLVRPTSPALFNTADTTLPDLVTGARGETWGALVVINAQPIPLRGARVDARVGAGLQRRTEIPEIAPLTVRKV